jgi:hypothetical protein
MGAHLLAHRRQLLAAHELTVTLPLPREAHLVVGPVLLGWVRLAAAAGFAADVVLRGEGLPQRGGHKTPARATYEKTPAFKQGQRFRAGIEGRISVLFRGRGMKRCVLTGRDRFDVFVGLAVLANNLLRIAELLTTTARRRRRAA